MVPVSPAPPPPPTPHQRSHLVRWISTGGECAHEALVMNLLLNILMLNQGQCILCVLIWLLKPYKYNYVVRRIQNRRDKTFGITRLGLIFISWKREEAVALCLVSIAYNMSDVSGPTRNIWSQIQQWPDVKPDLFHGSRPHHTNFNIWIQASSMGISSDGWVGELYS